MSGDEIVTPEVWADSVLFEWRQRGLKLNKGASPVELAQTEDRLGYHFNSFFKALYFRTNGFHQEDWLGHLVVLWPLDQIAQETSLHISGAFIAFGDYMISSAEYCFKMGEEGVFKLYNLPGKPAEKTASSFIEFVLMISQDDMLIY